MADKERERRMSLPPYFTYVPSTQHDATDPMSWGKPQPQEENRRGPPRKITWSDLSGSLRDKLSSTRKRIASYTIDDVVGIECRGGFAGYDRVAFDVGRAVPSNSGNSCMFRVSVDSSTWVTSSDYGYADRSYNWSGSVVGGGSSSYDRMQLGTGLNVATHMGLTLRSWWPHMDRDDIYQKVLTLMGWYNSSAAMCVGHTAQLYKGSSAITGIQFRINSNLINEGDALVEGW